MTDILENVAYMINPTPPGVFGPFGFFFRRFCCWCGTLCCRSAPLSGTSWAKSREISWNVEGERSKVRLGCRQLYDRGLPNHFPYEGLVVFPITRRLCATIKGCWRFLGWLKWVGSAIRGQMSGRFSSEISHRFKNVSHLDLPCVWVVLCSRGLLEKDLQKNLQKHTFFGETCLWVRSMY